MYDITEWWIFYTISISYSICYTLQNELRECVRAFGSNSKKFFMCTLMDEYGKIDEQIVENEIGNNQQK